MKPLYLESVGLAAPGLPNWLDSRPTLAGETPYVPAELALPQTALLPPNERRRMTGSVRLAFRAAEDALRAAPGASAGGSNSFSMTSADAPSASAGDKNSLSMTPAAGLATVFASSDSDLEVLHRINHSLAQPTRIISPTDFHNSVHNAAAGYWSIAVGSRQPSASIAAHDVSFAAGLLEAAALALGDGLNTLLVVYDLRAPAPIFAKRRIEQSFAVALVLTPERTARSLAALEMTLSQEPATTLAGTAAGVIEKELLSPALAPGAAADAALEALRLTNPAARALPLLRLLAQKKTGTVVLPAVESTLRIELRLP